MDIQQYASFSHAIRGVMPVRIKTVMDVASYCRVKVGAVTLALFPDGLLARVAK